MLAALAATAAWAQEAEDVREVRGERFCEVTYRTAQPCPTAVALLDGSDECLLRPSPASTGCRHRILVPLARGRALQYAILLADGGRGSVRPMAPATAWTEPLSAREEAGPGGRLFLHARTSLPARWSALVESAGQSETLTGGSEHTTSHIFDLGVLGAGGRLERVTVTARGVDKSQQLQVGPIAGNRGLVKALVEAVGKLDCDRLGAMAVDPRVKETRFLETYSLRARSTGLNRLLPGALARASQLVLDPELDGPGEVVPFSRAMGLVAFVDAAARTRSWEPLPGFRTGEPGFFPTVYPKTPTGFAKGELRRVWQAVAFWPGGNAGRLEDWTSDRAADKAQARKLTQAMLEATPAVLTLFDRGRPFLYLKARLTIPPRAPPVHTLCVKAGNLSPQDVLHVLLNDRVLIPLRNRIQTYPGSVLDGLRSQQLTLDQLLTNWVAVEVPTSLLRNGENSLVLTAESLNPDARATGWVLIGEFAIVAGSWGR